MCGHVVVSPISGPTLISSNNPSYFVPFVNGRWGNFSMRMRIWVSKTTILSKKGLFQWVEMEDMASKIQKKNTSACVKKPPLFYTPGDYGGRLMPYSYCAVRLCLL